ncbi:MAG: chorismate mutase [Pseudomonadota bacterium]
MTPEETLHYHRSCIDNLDAALIHIMAERFRVTKAVGRLKAEHELPPSDPEREKIQAKRLRKLATDANLDPDFAEKLLNFIISEVIQHHKQAQK